MSLKKRLAAVEEGGLTPRAAVTLWMREAHRFDSLREYGLWLQEQPEEAWPLVRMPRQVVEAVRRRNRGEPESLLGGEFRRAQADLLFLFFLHQHLNRYVAQEEEVLWPWLRLLAERLRGLILRKAASDRERLRNLTFPAELSTLGPTAPDTNAPTTPEDRELADLLSAWAAEERALRARVLGLGRTERLLSHRYLGDQELLYPRSRRRSAAGLEMLAGLRAVCREVVLAGPPPDEEGLIGWVIKMSTAPAWEEPPDQPAAGPPPEEEDPVVAVQARELARSLVTSAKTEALRMLGEPEAGLRLLAEGLSQRPDAPRL